MEIAENSGGALTELQISPFREKWNLFRKNRSAVFSLWFLIFLLVLSIAAKLLTLFRHFHAHRFFRGGRHDIAEHFVDDIGR